MLWKHTDWRNGQSEVRRSRRLAVSMVATVGNYDYGFYWYFYQDGTIQMEVKLTGIMNTTALKPGEPARYGTEVAPRLIAPYHQHYFNARLDFAVDGENNTVHEVNTRSVPAGRENPYQQRLLHRGDAAPERVAGPAQHQSGLVAVLAGRQPRPQERHGPTRGVPALPRRDRPCRSPSPVHRS